MSLFLFVFFWNNNIGLKFAEFTGAIMRRVVNIR